MAKKKVKKATKSSKSVKTKTDPKPEKTEEPIEVEKKEETEKVEEEKVEPTTKEVEKVEEETKEEKSGEEKEDDEKEENSEVKEGSKGLTETSEVFKRKSEFSLETPSKRVVIRGLDFNFILLAMAIISIPIAYLFLYINLYQAYFWLPYLMLLDIIFLTALFFFRKTIFIAFLLNTAFSIIYLAINGFLLEINGLSDFISLIPDFVIGLTMWRFYKN